MSFIKKFKNLFSSEKKELKKTRKKQQKNYDSNKTINNYNYIYNTHILPNNSTNQIDPSLSSSSTSTTTTTTTTTTSSKPQHNTLSPVSLEKHSDAKYNTVNTSPIKSNKITPTQEEQDQNCQSPSFEDQISEYKKLQRDRYKSTRTSVPPPLQLQSHPQTLQQQQPIPLQQAFIPLHQSQQLQPQQKSQPPQPLPQVPKGYSTTTGSKLNQSTSSSLRNSTILPNGNIVSSPNTLKNSSINQSGHNNLSHSQSIYSQSPKNNPYSPLKSSSNLLRRSSHKLRMNKSEYQRLYFSSRDGGLFINDLPLRLKGINWFGCETETFTVHGLWARDYKQYLDFLKEHRFNAIRIPFSLEMIMKDPFPTSITITPQINKEFYGLRALSVLDMIIEAAGERGMLILLDLHSFGPNDRLHDGLWYNNKYNENDVMKMWNILILRYGRVWNVLGVDLKNEPFSATWDTSNEKTDWDKAINRIGSYIQNNGGNQWLIFGQGIPVQSQNNMACCWGESFDCESTSQTSSVSLPLNDKFVYSPHCYGPSVVNHSHFRDRDFPHNLFPHWDLNFGLLPTNTGRAVVVGEWGGKYIDNMDKIWMDAFVDYLIEKKCTDNFFWCLNPNSGDTGGIYLDDWVCVNNEKLNLLNKLVPHPTKIKLDKDIMIFKVSSVVPSQMEA
ncbi:hypothetical protein DICPUDRAFT_152047 [Dictyostelium purpureum]|uniref:Glycoside hydrolase family 5 domain-containing protein n=1 Tax=Dictyostelium purpureum TaxID=5786 RepID=F0ZKC3_DICPU|nr:uncharacterized protein DICPUDRAFT_152047 [Dictyostelium purpureum]EGC35631.1 hypothetical protein DICPUDRAFT_152047 [Dictyostelium purpureum]|eukprot:XP_003287868.1 hypothetical protein DICPUDRAFT_152047 [Dictyostelium purpureum]